MFRRITHLLHPVKLLLLHITPILSNYCSCIAQSTNWLVVSAVLAHSTITPLIGTQWLVDVQFRDLIIGFTKQEPTDWFTELSRIKRSRTGIGNFSKLFLKVKRNQGMCVLYINHEEGIV